MIHDFGHCVIVGRKHGYFFTITFHIYQRFGGNSFVSGSNGGIEISGSAFHLLNGTITASNVDLSGKITADSGEIGGFAITENAISSSNNELILRGHPGAARPASPLGIAAKSCQK